MRAPALVLTLLLPVLAAAQPAPDPPGAPADTLLWIQETELHLLAADARSVALAHRFVDGADVSCRVDGVPWRPGEDFHVDGVRGVWFAHHALSETPDTTVLVRLEYRFQPGTVPPDLALRPVRAAPEPTPDDRVPGTSSGPPPAGETGDLTVSGSKTVRMASGNRRDLTVDQTLRLDIAGQLTETIRVQAALSDDNLPVVPEGNTEQLRDVDRVRVELWAPRWHAVLGDLVATREGGAFGGYRRKLQGATLSVEDEQSGVSALAGAPRGLYRTLQIRGEEANQGPYFLGGGGAGTNLFIVAGSEQVRLDGETLTRGADRDYVIDYVRGSVTFTYRRLVTADSEIVVEFEEGEGPYARTVVGAEGRHAARPDWLGGRELRFSTAVIRESDDATRLRLGELDDADRDALAAAGDDADAAVASGLAAVAPGEGSYRLETVGGFAVAVYDSLAGNYQVGFYYAGPQLGDYAVSRLTPTGEQVFVYRGPGGGPYRIGRPLPLPSSQSLATLRAGLGEAAAPLLDLEWHHSAEDRNILSGVGDGDNGGAAWRAAVATGERAWLGGRGGLRVVHEDLGTGFRPFQLARDRFHYERWGLAERARRTGFLAESDAETAAELRWASGAVSRRVSTTLDWGRLRHGGAVEAARAGAAADWSLGRLGGASRFASSDAADAVDPLDVSADAQAHELSLRTAAAVPRLRYEREQYADAAIHDLRAAGHRRRRWTGELAAPAGGRWDWVARFERGLSDSLRSGDWTRQRDSRTLSWRVGTPQLGGMRLTADGAVRTVHVPAGADLKARLAKLDLHGRWDRAGSDWGLSYALDNSRVEVLDRQVVYVGVRTGDYDGNGDFVGQGQGDYNVVTVGTDSLVATTEARADLTWRQDFALLGKDRIWGAWQSFTRVTARGRSTTEDIGELLRFQRAALFDPLLTVLGQVEFRQELVLLRHLPAWDLRLRRDFDESLDRQYAAHPERRLRRHDQGTVIYNPGPDTSWRFRVQRTDERRLTQESALGGNGSYDSRTDRQELAWILRAAPGTQLTLAVDRVRRGDAVSGIAQGEWGLRPQARARLAERWSLTTDFRWSTVDETAPAVVVRPFFYPYPGGNAETTLRLDWKTSGTLGVALNWFGRKLGERGWQHDLRLESTARF